MIWWINCKVTELAKKKTKKNYTNAPPHVADYTKIRSVL
jgi:hypothetical protein